MAFTSSFVIIGGECDLNYEQIYIQKYTNVYKGVEDNGNKKMHRVWAPGERNDVMHGY